MKEISGPTALEELRLAAYHVVVAQEEGHLADPGLHEHIARLRWALNLAWPGEDPDWPPGSTNPDLRPAGRP